jgi:copper transport protein
MGFGVRLDSRLEHDRTLIHWVRRWGCGVIRHGHIVLVIVLALLLITMAPAPAYAHASLVRSDPAPDALLPGAPGHIHLWFSEDVNPLASRIIVWDRNRVPETVGGASVVPGHQQELVVRLKRLRPGSYLVLWTSVSADDGHLVRGYFSFSVRARGQLPSVPTIAGPSRQTFPDAPGLIGLVAHWIELLAAVTWVGMAACSAFFYLPIGRAVEARVSALHHRRTRAFMRLALGVLALSSTVVVLTEAYGIAGNDWSQVPARVTIAEVFAGQYGQVWVARQVLVLVAVVLGFIQVQGLSLYRSYREHVNVQTIVGLGYLYAMAASGHAASAAVGVLPGSHENLFSLSVFADWLHYVADALWLGGQTYLVLVLIPVLRLRRELRHTGVFLRVLDRFSPAAYASVATFTLSGVFAAKVHIPSWYAFFTSTYGRALLVKVVLIAVMMLISAVTVFRLRPRLRQSGIVADGTDPGVSPSLMRPLLRWLGVNPVLGAAVLLATSVMFSYPVPPAPAPTEPQAYNGRGGDVNAGLVRCNASATPGKCSLVPAPRTPAALLPHLRNSR